MAISRQKKENIVESLKEKLASTEVVIVADYRGLSVPEQQALRSKLRETEAEFQVVKNSLMKIALRELNRPIPDDLLAGPTALALLKEDISGPAQALLDFAKQSGILEIKGGILGDRVIDAHDVQDLAALPPKEVLLAQLLGAIQGPAAALVGMLEAPAGELIRTLQAPMRELAMTIQAYADSQQ